MTFLVKWRVIEVVSGPGQHDDGVRDGDTATIADGVVSREAESEDAIRRELTAALEKAFPPHALGPTYDLLRRYEIDITPEPEIDPGSGPSFLCPKCKMRSYNAKDIEHGYCGNCNEFTGVR